MILETYKNIVLILVKRKNKANYFIYENMIMVMIILNYKGANSTSQNFISTSKPLYYSQTDESIDN